MAFNPKRIMDQLYRTFGVSATLDYGATAPVTCTVIDRTKGVDVGEGDVLQQSIRPVAAARMYELTAAGVTTAELDGGSITFNGKTWDVKSYQLRPSPEGELQGEVYLILSEP